VQIYRNKLGQQFCIIVWTKRQHHVAKQMPSLIIHLHHVIYADGSELFPNSKHNKINKQTSWFTNVYNTGSASNHFRNLSWLSDALDMLRIGKGTAHGSTEDSARHLGELLHPSADLLPHRVYTSLMSKLYTLPCGAARLQSQFHVLAEDLRSW
jgi:hypothetical protein